MTIPADHMDDRAGLEEALAVGSKAARNRGETDPVARLSAEPNCSFQEASIVLFGLRSARFGRVLIQAGKRQALLTFSEDMPDLSGMQVLVRSGGESNSLGKEFEIFGLGKTRDPNVFAAALAVVAKERGKSIDSCVLRGCWGAQWADFVEAAALLSDAGFHRIDAEWEALKRTILIREAPQLPSAGLKIPADWLKAPPAETRPAQPDRFSRPGLPGAAVVGIGAAPQTAPAPAKHKIALPKDAGQVVFVVDASGAMIHTFDGVRQSVADAVNALPKDVRFHLIVMQQRQPLETASRGLAAAGDDQKKQAGEVLAKALPMGDTDPVPALTRAFEVLDNKEKGAKALVLVLDGFTESAEKVKRTIEGKAKALSVAVHIYVFSDSITSEASKALKEAAEGTGGRFVFVKTEE